jgi:Rrf2 family protein
MFKKETEYALRALVYIFERNTNGHRPGIAEIAEEILAPPSFTAKILQKLVKSELLMSQKGKGGGFFFKKDQDDIILKDVIILIEGHKIFNSCGFGLGSCTDHNPCPIHGQYVHVRAELNRIFEKNTVREIASNRITKT